MKWQGREESQNVEDRRGMRPATAGSVGGLGTLIIVVLGLLFGLEARPGQADCGCSAKGPAAAGGRGAAVESTPEEDAQLSFVKVVLRDTEKVWGEQFRKMGIDVSRAEDGRLPRCC